MLPKMCPSRDFEEIYGPWELMFLDSVRPEERENAEKKTLSIKSLKCSGNKLSHIKLEDS